MASAEDETDDIEYIRPSGETVFNLKSVEAYTFKILVEFLANYVKNIQPRLTKNGLKFHPLIPMFLNPSS